VVYTVDVRDVRLRLTQRFFGLLARADVYRHAKQAGCAITLHRNGH
jgi:hypothetical protein